MFFDGSSSSRKEVNLGGKRKGLAANAKDKASFVEQVSSLRAEREAQRRSENSASKLSATWRAYAGNRSLRFDLEQRRGVHLQSFIDVPSPATLASCVVSLNATHRCCLPLYALHRRRSFVDSLSSLAAALSAAPPATLQSFCTTQHGVAALQMLLDFVKRNAEERFVKLSHDGAALAEVSSFSAFSMPEPKGPFHAYTPAGRLLLERRRALALQHSALLAQQTACLLTMLSSVSRTDLNSPPAVRATVQLLGSTIVTAAWLEWIMTINPAMHKPEIVDAAAELTKDWIQLAVAAQQQKLSADSSSNCFVLAALLLGFPSSSSSSSSSPPSSSPVTHLSSALLSIFESGHFADIGHWCRLLSRRRDIAAQLFDHLRHLLLPPPPSLPSLSPPSAPLLHPSRRISIARLMRLLSSHALDPTSHSMLPLSDLHAMDDLSLPFDAFVAAVPPFAADATPHSVTEAIVKQLLGCLHDVLSPSSLALSSSLLSSSPPPPASSSSPPPPASSSSPPPPPPSSSLHIDHQAVVDICSLLFTLVTRSRNPTIPLIFIIHGQHLLPPLFSLLSLPVSTPGQCFGGGAGLTESCKHIDPLLPHPAWFTVLWVAVVIMNERMDIDDDQEIADGRLLPPAALCTFLSAIRGVLCRLTFLNPPAMPPPPASIMLADMSQEHTGLANFALNDWTCGEQQWLSICAHLRDVSCAMMRKAYHRYKCSPAWSSSFGFRDAVFEMDARHSSALAAGLHLALERDAALQPSQWLNCDVVDDFIQSKVKFGSPALFSSGTSDTDVAYWRSTGLCSPDPSFHPLSIPKACATTIGRAIITRAPFLMPFTLRAELFQDMCSALQDDDDDAHHFFHMRRLSIYRSRLFDMGLQAVSEHARALRTGFQIRFLSDDDVAEDGVDGGGLFKEFLTLLLRELMNMDRGYFTETAAHQLWPHPQAIQFHGSDIFRNIGRVLGMALHHHVLVEHSFATFFLQAILNRHTTIQDLPSLSTDLAASLQKLKKFDNEQLAALDMTFEIDDDSGGMGVVKTVDLLPQGGGARRRVLTHGDVNQYIICVTKYWMFERIKHHVEHIRLGINDVAPLDFFNMFNSTELQTLLSGSEAAIDVDDWRAHCSYHGFSGNDDPILVMFWKIVEEFSPQQRSQLLHYVTSCSRPPLLGFAALNPGFQIQLMHFRGAAPADANAFLPMAATCMNILKLPPYTDIGTMRSKLEYAMNSNSGFFLA